MESATFRKWLAEHGCTFEKHQHAKGGGIASVTVRRGRRRSVLPLAGSRKRLDPEVIERIREDLGLTRVALPGRPD